MKGRLGHLGKASGTGTPQLPSDPWKLADLKALVDSLVSEGRTESIGLKC